MKSSVTNAKTFAPGEDSMAKVGQNDVLLASFICWFLQLDLLQFLHKLCSGVAGVASHQLERTCHRINSSDVSLRKGAAQYPFAYCALSTIKMTTECSRDLCKIRSHFQNPNEILQHVDGMSGWVLFLVNIATTLVWMCWDYVPDFVD